MPQSAVLLPLRLLTRDARLLFATRIVRLFAYGQLAVVLFLYLREVGFGEPAIGLLLTLTLLGDTAVTLAITTVADRVGRRRMLLLGAGLMLATGVVFANTSSFLVLLVVATLGVISPSGYEVGPFIALEQASLTETIRPEDRTRVFAWYNMVGSFATALGSLSGGWVTQLLQDAGRAPLESYRVVLFAYSGIGLLLALLFALLTPAVEVHARADASSTLPRFGLGRNRKVVLKLAGLFSMDAFGGGFVVQSVVCYWFSQRFGAEPGMLGSIFFGANILAGVSALSAAWVASKIGLINTMVFTHLPSNLLLMLVPLMPNLELAIAVLLLRFSISQMDVPTRQSYTMAVVDPEERSAAAGVTGVARTIGASLSPLLTGRLLASAALFSAPFFLSGGVKIVYDLLLWREFRRAKPPEEVAAG
jgi:MFS family permease